MTSTCPHGETAYARRGPHIAEVCLQCGRSVRGPGAWVPRAELLAAGIDPAALVSWDSVLAAVEARQPSLFGSEGDCQ